MSRPADSIRSGKRPQAVLLLGCLILAGCSSDPPPPIPVVQRETEVRLEGRPDLYVRRGDEWFNLTRFDRPQHILDHAVSPDGQWVFVVHVDYAPARLSVFRFETGENALSQSLSERGEPRWYAPAMLRVFSGTRLELEQDFAAR